MSTASSPLPSRGTTSRPDPAAARAVTLVGLAVGLLATAVAVSAGYSRLRGDLDASTFAVGVAATLGLLGVGVVLGLTGRPTRPRTGPRTVIAGWPLGVGAVSAGVMLGVLLDDGDAVLYLVGLLIVVLAVGGCLLAPSGPPMVAALFGGAVLYSQVVDDVVDGIAPEEGFLGIALAIGLFVLIATAVSWTWRISRVLIAVVAGAAGIVGLFSVLTAGTVFVQVSAAFSGGAPSPDFDGDVAGTLLVAAVLMAVWVVLGLRTGHPGFRVLLLAMPVAVVPLSLFALTVERPSLWGLVIGVVGGLLLVAVALPHLRRPADGGTPPGASTPPPPPPAPNAPTDTAPFARPNPEGPR